MKEIIRYITEEFTKNLINLRWEFYQAPEDLSDFVLNARKATDELGRRFVQEMVQEMNVQMSRTFFSGWQNHLTAHT